MDSAVVIYHAPSVGAFTVALAKELPQNMNDAVNLLDMDIREYMRAHGVLATQAKTPKGMWMLQMNALAALDEAR